jgi:hypothetical protein
LGRLALVVVTVALMVGACAGGQGATFDPAGPCVADGQEPGAYPELEALLPDRFDGRSPARLDSGRNCRPGSLGALADAGIDEFRFAGALFETGSRSGVTLAVFEAANLSVKQMAAFYEAGARQAPKTEQITTGDYPTRGPVEGWRLDTLNDESFQTIVVLSDPRPGTVRAALVASDIREIGTREAHEDVVRRAVESVLAGKAAATRS